MDVDRPPHPRDYPSSSREGPSREPTDHQALLLHHPVPQQQVHYSFRMILIAIDCVEVVDLEPWEQRGRRM